MVKKKSKESGRGKEYDISPLEFVAIWERAESAEEVAEQTGMPVPIVHARASKYRKQGVKLKKMRKSSPRTIDVEAMNKLVDEIRKLQKEENEEGSNLETLLQELLKRVSPSK